MTLDLSVAMLVRDPPIDRLALLVDYMSSIATEFVIVDTGSSSHDIAVMQAWNKAPFGFPKVNILRKPWPNDFALARNWGVEAVTRKWTLILDPDELPSEKMMEHIRHAISYSDTTYSESAGWLYRTVNYSSGVRDPEQDFHWHVRLFRTGRGRFYRALDELVALDGRDESYTRGTILLPKAPRDAYLIHSKDSDSIERARETYERMRREGKDRV